MAGVGRALDAMTPSPAAGAIGSGPLSASAHPGRLPRPVSLPRALTPGAASSFEVDDGKGRYASAFSSAPSGEEVAGAIDTIRQVFSPATFRRIFEEGSSSTLSKDIDVKSSTESGKIYKSSTISQAEIMEPKMKLYNPKTNGSHKVINAFCSLQSNPSIQRMVTSLSSDKAVWEAVMKNAAVKELRDSFSGVERTKMRNTGSSSLTMVEMILDWILDMAKTKIMEILGKIWNIGNDIFNHRDEVKVAAVAEDAVRSSFMLSVVVFMVVVAFRLLII